MEPDAALVVCRFLHDAGAMLVWGGAAYLAVLVPAGLAADVARRLWPCAILAAAVSVAATLAMLPTEAALVGNGWSDAFGPDALSGFLFDTTGGAGWSAQAAAALMLLGAVLVPARRRLAATAAAAGLALATLALTGHAVMRDGGAGEAQRLNDMLHVLSAGAWFGALVPLAMILRRLDAHTPDAPIRDADAATALRRFSSAGHAAVALAILTGIGNTLFIVGGVPADWSSPYQAMLSGKIAVVAAMVALALANRYALVPRMGAPAGDAVRTLRRTTLVEVALGVVAIALVAAFGTLDPLPA
jgi:putative copper resistance protein D